MRREKRMMQIHGSMLVAGDPMVLRDFKIARKE